MKKIVLCLFVLSACSPDWQTHNPSLAKQPKDMQRYSMDLNDCRTEAMKDNKHPYAQLFGLIGTVATMDDDTFKKPNTLIDECMARKKYAVIPN